jgi:hypothetical protein
LNLISKNRLETFFLCRVSSICSYVIGLFKFDQKILFQVGNDIYCSQLNTDNWIFADFG